MTALERHPGTNDVTQSLDGIRGLLAVWVLLSHVTQMVNGPRGLVDRGGIAVDLFMLVSGFLMVWTVVTRAVREPLWAAQTWRRFIVRRFFRIAPLYFFAFAIAYVFAPFFDHAIEFAYSVSKQEFVRPFRACLNNRFLDLLYHFTFVFGLFPCYASTNVLPDWSLSLEMQFYALFPVLLFLTLGRFRVVFVILALAVVGLFHAKVSVYVPNSEMWFSMPQPSLLPLRLNCFLAGMLLAALILKRVPKYSGLLLLICCLIVFQRTTFSCIALFVSLMLLARGGVLGSWPSGFFAPIQIINSWLCGPRLKFLGDISFGVYLVHLPILLLLLWFLNRSALFVAMTGSSKFWLVSITLLIATLLISSLLHKWIERPMIELARKLTR